MYLDVNLCVILAVGLVEIEGAYCAGGSVYRYRSRFFGLRSQDACRPMRLRPSLSGTVSWFTPPWVTSSTCRDSSAPFSLRSVPGCNPPGNSSPSCWRSSLMNSATLP